MSDYQPFPAPPLSIIHIDDLMPGDILWGWEEGANYVRKGWHVEPEGTQVDGRGLRHADDRLVINNMHFLKGYSCPRYVLVEGPK